MSSGKTKLEHSYEVSSLIYSRCIGRTDRILYVNGGGAG